MPRDLLVNVVLGLTVLVACGGGEKQVVLLPAAPPDPALHGSLSRLFAAELAPGMVVAAVRGGRIVYLDAFGWADREARRPVTPDTRFYIASSTKPFTALLVGLLARDGAIELDAPLSRYLPELELAAPLSADRITVRQLLTHTHGIDGNGPVVWRTAYSGDHTPELLVRLLSRHRPLPEPTAFRYSNVGYVAASLIVDRVTAVSWKELLEQRVLEPLGMRHTTAFMSRVAPELLAQPYAAAPVGFERLRPSKGDSSMHAAGGLVSTAPDLARWVLAQLGGGRLAGRTVFAEELIRESQRQQVEQDARFGEYHRVGYGLGWQIGRWEEKTLVHHFGSFAGYYAHVSFMPGEDTGVVVLVNEDDLGGRLAEAAAQTVYAHLLAWTDAGARLEQRLLELGEKVPATRARLAEHRAERAARQRPLPHPLSAYEGTFVNDEMGRMTLRARGGALVSTMGLLEGPVEVYGADRNELRLELVPGMGMVARVEMGPDGLAASLSLRGMTFVREGRPPSVERR
jgi:CubicO group peptidase (beta-lactamase class C family)